MVECKGCGTLTCEFTCKRLVCEMLRNRLLSLFYCVKHSEDKSFRDKSLIEIEKIFDELNSFENIEQKKSDGTRHHSL